MRIKIAARSVPQHATGTLAAVCIRDHRGVAELQQFMDQRRLFVNAGASVLATCSATPSITLMRNFRHSSMPVRQFHSQGYARQLSYAVHGWPVCESVGCDKRQRRHTMSANRCGCALLVTPYVLHIVDNGSTVKRDPLLLANFTAMIHHQRMFAGSSGE